MPSYTRGFTREDLKFVKAHAGNIWFGFKAKDMSAVPGISAADVAALGWVNADGVPSGGIGVLRANSPKPQRVKKIINRRPNANQQGSASTYCSYSSFTAAQAAGWDLIGSARRVTISNNFRTKTVGAKIDGSGAIYLFPLNAADATSYAATLGLVLPENISEAERDRAFSGSSRPRPAKMGKVISETTGATFSTFVSYDNEDNALENGFEYIRAAILPPIPYLTPPA